MTDYTKLIDQIKDNFLFILISILMMAAVYFIAWLSEKAISSKTGVQFRHSKTKISRMTIMAMLSAIAFVLMFFEFPLPIAPAFYEIDISEVPVLIGAFMFGPCAGVAIEGIKILLNLAIRGTTTVFVGDFANFILGCIYIIPAAVIYHSRKNRKRAVMGLTVGGLILTVAGCFMNAFYLLPKYAELFGTSIDKLVYAGTAINPAITNIFTFVALAVAPFNIIKATIVGIVTTVLYKYISRLFKA